MSSDPVVTHPNLAGSTLRQSRWTARAWARATSPRDELSPSSQIPAKRRTQYLPVSSPRSMSRHATAHYCRSFLWHPRPGHRGEVAFRFAGLVVRPRVGGVARGARELASTRFRSGCNRGSREQRFVQFAHNLAEVINPHFSCTAADLLHVSAPFEASQPAKYRECWPLGVTPSVSRSATACPYVLRDQETGAKAEASWSD